MCSSIGRTLLQYCPTENAKCLNIKLQKNLPSVHTAAPEKKFRFVPSLSVLHVSDQSGPAATPPPSHRKSSNIYIFNPIKNVKRKDQSALRHAAKYQQSSSVVCHCDLHGSEVLILLQAPFTTSWNGRNKEKASKQFKQSVITNHTFICDSEIISATEPQTTGLSSGPVGYQTQPSTEATLHTTTMDHKGAWTWGPP